MADPIVTPVGSTRFQLEGSLTSDTGAPADQDVIAAIPGNRPFPNRPNGKIELGSIELKGDTGKNFAVYAGQATIGFHASADFKSRLGVFDSAADAVSSLQLTDASENNLNVAGDGSERFLVLLPGYDLQGSFFGSHPIGVVASLAFRATGDYDLPGIYMPAGWMEGHLSPHQCGYK